MHNTQKQNKKEARRKGAQLIWRFLQGSVALFAVSIACAGIMALADMITPQIIRVAVDNVNSGNPMNEGTLAARALMSRSSSKLSSMRENTVGDG